MIIKIDDAFIEMYGELFKDMEGFLGVDGSNDLDMAIEGALVDDCQGLQDVLHEETGQAIYQERIKNFRESRFIEIQETSP